MNIKELIIGLTVSMLLGIGVAVTAHVIRGLKNKLYNWFPERRRVLLFMACIYCVLCFNYVIYIPTCVPKLQSINLN